MCLWFDESAAEVIALVTVVAETIAETRALKLVTSKGIGIPEI
jgi:hypothetical protein